MTASRTSVRGLIAARTTDRADRPRRIGRKAQWDRARSGARRRLPGGNSAKWRKVQTVWRENIPAHPALQEEEKISRSTFGRRAGDVAGGAGRSADRVKGDSGKALGSRIGASRRAGGARNGKQERTSTACRARTEPWDSQTNDPCDTTRARTATGRQTQANHSGASTPIISINDAERIKASPTGTG
jgi:hypothetical protein